MVGAFHGLSRERSDARKYPAIHPIDSWSKYRGIAEQSKVDAARQILVRSTEIGQMRKVVGEEGVSAEDYITYQKGELLDAAYLQQDSFDAVDAACGPGAPAARICGAGTDILTRTYLLEEKSAIRTFFNRLRQLLLDWHADGSSKRHNLTSRKDRSGICTCRNQQKRRSDMQKVYTRIRSIVGNVITVEASGVRNGDLALVATAMPM